MLESIGVPVLLLHVAIAIATGGLIGMERERRPERKFAGLRTLALLCGIGPIVVSVSISEEYPLFIAIYLALAAAIGISIAYIRFAISGPEVGLTTSVTVFLVALLGVLIGYGRLFESTSIAIITVLLLAERDRLHGYVDRLSDEELRASVQLAALGFILYPILPTDPIDPFGVVVLREVLLFAIFVLLIEFSSFVLMRQFGGSKGLAVTGLLAGSANSLATAGVVARVANRTPTALDAASFALLLATASMIVRNVGLAVVLAAELLPYVWLPALAMLGVTIAIAAVIGHHGERTSFEIELGSPLSFAAATKFSAAYVGILVVSVVAEEFFGEMGLYATAFVGGLVSSAAVSVSAATVFNEGTAPAEATVGMIVLGIVASLTSKIVLVEALNGEMRTKAVVPMAVVGSVGLVVFAVFVVI